MRDRVLRYRGVAVLVLLVVAVFGDVLFLPGDKTPSASYGDVNRYFSTARAFGFGEIGRGNLPLWDPHIFSGTPFLATFQSALLYPPNLVYVVLPLPKAVSVDLALHVLLFGLFTFAWARSRGVSRAGATFGGVVAMFSGAFFHRVQAGHVTVIDGAAWIPLVLLSVERLLRRPSVGWVAAGVLAVTMQWLAGMPQVVFITFVTAFLLCIFQPMGWVKRPATAGALGVMAVFPVLLAAAQLLTSFEAMQYAKSHGGGSYEFATAHSFPLANLLTLLVPHVYGDYPGFYWGGSHVWEVTFYIGIVGLFLAVFGMLHGPHRSNVALYGAAAVLILLALGSSTPLYRVVYRLPGFSMFRGPARFLIPCTAILAIFAGNGYDALVQRKGRPVVYAGVLLLTAGLLMGGAWWLYNLPKAGESSFLLWDFVVKAHGAAVGTGAAIKYALYTAPRLAVSGGVCVVLAVLVASLKRVKPAPALILIVGVIELPVFAATTRSSFRLGEGISPEFDAAVADLGKGRVFEDPYRMNHAYKAGALNIWGYEPVIQQRYVEFIARATHVKKPLSLAGRDPSFLDGATLGPLLRVVRMRAYSDGKRLFPVLTEKPPLPPFFLVNRYQVASGEKMLEAMESPGFDPLWQVMLEEQPNPAPDPKGNYGKVSVVEESSDRYVLDVDAPSPAILVNTDAFAPGWRAKPLAAGPQDNYRVMAADYAVRAIPLAAGKHRILLEYAPRGFTVGAWVSGVSAMVLAVIGVVALSNHCRGARRVGAGKKIPQ